MAQKNRALMIIGSIFLGLVTMLLVYVILISTGAISGRKYTIRIEAISCEKEYDGTPLYLKEYRIVEGQEYLEQNGHVESVSFSGSQTDVGESTGYPEVLIFDDSNAEVTSKYNIIVAGATIKVTPRTITVRTYGAEKAYDGSSIDVSSVATPFEVISGEAAAGQSWNLSASGTQTEIGSSPVVVDIEVFDKNNNPINPDNYRVVYEEGRGEITVRPRYLFVNMQVNNQYQIHYYNGNPHTVNDPTVITSRSELRSGETVSYIHSTFSGINAGTYELNEYEFKVVDSMGRDVTSLYTIDPNSNFGTYEITPIPLTLVTNELAPHVYDGEEFTGGNHYSVQNWTQAPGTDHYEVKMLASITEVGEVENSAEIIIYNLKGEDVTSNYDIEYNFSTLEVVKRQITITTYSLSKPFDGTPIVGRDVLNEDNEYYSITTGTLVSGHEIDVTLGKKISDVGDTLNTVDKVVIIDSKRNDVTKNYDIQKNEGNLEITKTSIQIATASGTWDYDGLEHSATDDPDVSGLPNTCHIVFYEWPVLTNVVYDKNGNTTTVDNKPEYVIYDATNNKVFDSKNKNYQDNFTVSSEVWGKLQINPLEMTIQTGNYERDYDGEMITCHDAQVIAGNKRTTDTIIYSWPNDYVNVLRNKKTGEVLSVENKPTVVVIDKYNNDITNNYIIKIEAGYLKVNPVSLFISTENVDKVYDGTPLVVKDSDWSITGLRGGDHIDSVSTVSNYVNVEKKSRNNEIEFVIRDSANQDVTGNYDISYEKKGILTIYPVIINFRTLSPQDPFIYDGLEHTYSEYEVLYTNLTEEESQKFSIGNLNFTKFVNANESGTASSRENKCTWVLMMAIDGGGNVIVDKSNYTPNEEWGSVVVRKMKVYQYLETHEKDFDGTPFKVGDVATWFELQDQEGNNIINAQGKLTTMPTVTVSLDETALNNAIKDKKDATSGVEYKVKLVFTDESGKDISDNFDVVKADNSKPLLVIKKVNIRIQTPNVDAVYDGVERTYTDNAFLKVQDNGVYYNISTDSNIPTVTSDGREFYCQLSNFTRFKDANKTGEYNECDFKLYIRTINGFEVVDAKNYNLDKQYGKVIVSPFTISVSSLDQYHQYDGNPVVYNEAGLAGSDLQNYRNSWFVISNLEDLPTELKTNASEYIKVDVSGLNDSIKSYVDYSSTKTYSYKMKLKIEKAGDNKINDNYKFECGDGKIVIEQIEIVVNDNNPLVMTNYTGESYWGENDSVWNTYKTNIEVVGCPLGYTYDFIKKEFINVNINNLMNQKNEFTIKFYKDDKPVLQDNFHITYNYNTIIIDYKKITVTNKNITKNYKGDAYSYLSEDYIIADGWFELSDNTIDYEIDVDGFNQYLSTMVNYKEDGYSTDITKYLSTSDTNIKFETHANGKFTINRITIKAYCKNTKDQTETTLAKYYDGTPLYPFTSNLDVIFDTTSKNKLIELYGVADINEVYPFIELVSCNSITNVKRGDKNSVEREKVEANISFKNVHGDDVTNNFIIDADYGYMRINPIVLTFKSGSYEFDYDGLPHSYDVLDLYDVDLGDSSLDISDYTIDTSDGRDVPSFTECGDVDKSGIRRAYENDIKYTLLVTRNSDSVDVTSNFNTRTVNGKITILPKKIQIRFKGAEMTFNGYVLSLQGYYEIIGGNKVYKNELMDNGFLEISSEYLDFLNDVEAGFTWDIVPTGEQYTVGVSESTYEFVITDSTGKDVSKSFEVTNIEKAKNKLEVKKLEITMESKSKTKIYDPLDPTLEFKEIMDLSTVESMLPLGWYFDDISSWTWASQDGIGKCKNEFTVILRDGNGDNYLTGEFASSVVITKVYGDLEVIPYITGTGNLVAYDNESDPLVTSFAMQVDKVGTYYLRDRSYGNFNGLGWDYIPDYSGEYSDINGNTILSKVLDDNSYSNSSHMILSVSPNMPYLVPYYATSADLYTNTNGGDTHVAKAHNNISPYEYDVFNYKYNLVSKELSDENYILFEAAYREYVYENYLTISADLRNRIFKELEGAPKGDEEDLIVKIAEYIRSNRFTYGNNDENRKNAEDIVELFLFDLVKGRRGTCQDFASSACMLYRAYGIPARFTTGFVCGVTEDGTYRPDTQINVNQTLAHAWVEIYIDGMGWVPVEVTPTIEINISNGGDSGESLSDSLLSGDVDKTPHAPQNKVILEVKSNHSGTFYLRGQSFGNYNGAGFDTVDPLDTYTDPSYNPLTYVGVSNTNYQVNRMYITNKGAGFKARLTPYYSVDNFSDSDDTYLCGNYNSKYAVDYIIYPYESYEFVGALSGVFVSKELTYRAYVNSMYKSMDGASSDLLAYLDSIISANGLNVGTTAEKIKKVQKYLQEDAGLTYSFDYDYSLSSDVALSFLSTTKKGVCQHYAMAGTLILRRLGIAARYTCGVVANISNDDALKNKTVAIRDSSAHAWVEVYIDGMGWCPLEVTGAAAGARFDYGEGEEDVDIDWDSTSDVRSITLQPHPIEAKYDPESGTIETTVLLSDLSFEEASNYTITGRAQLITNNFGDDNISVITEYRISNKLGVDVTRTFNVTLLPRTDNKLYLEKILITTQGATKYYDGTPLTCHEIASYNSEDIHAGHTFNPENLVFDKSITKAGKTVNTFNIGLSTNLITDSLGNDVTYQYWVVPSAGGILEVKPNNLTITAEDLELDYEDYLDYVALTGEDNYYHLEIASVIGLRPGDYIDPSSIEFNSGSYLSEDQDFAENVIDSVIIRNSSDEDVTDCYKITFVEGYLEIIY